ncbi:hypothetical protein C6P42_003274 [Pichia californica]|nr:hypothetical protein C6P42_003274 [[Candida] californica]
MSTSNVVERTVEFLKPIIEAKLKSNNAKPIVVGIEGPQGSGKSYASSRIKNILSESYNTCNIIQFSMDDFYLTYEQQQIVSSKYKDNILLQGRGLPGTHDVTLLLNIISHLIANDSSRYPISIPIYDKSAHNGKGDRQSNDTWLNIHKPVDVIIFEGWFNGYTSISENQNLINKWHSIRKKFSPKFNSIDNDSISEINDNLQEYEDVWKMFDIFICIKTSDINNVYTWRKQQEHELIEKKGSGMTDEEVEKFIDRYMPIYYLYYDRLEELQNKISGLELNIDKNRILIDSKEYNIELIKDQFSSKSV